MERNIYLIRHGGLDNPENIVYGREFDLHLSEDGRKKVADLAEKIKKSGDKIAEIFASPLNRTMESAQIISETLGGIIISSDDRLAEIASHNLSGRSLEWLDNLSDPYQEAEKYNYQIEKLEAAASRVIECIKEKLAGAVSARAFVSHGDPLAFAFWKMQHPREVLPAYPEIRKQYLAKATAWHVEVDENLAVINFELIT